MDAQIDLAWLAGFVDGEGGFSVHYDPRAHKRFSIQLLVGNTDRESLERCQSIAGLGNILKRHSKLPNQRDWWVWTVYGRNAQEVTRRMLPYMTTKRLHGEIVAQFPIGQAGKRVPYLTKLAQTVAYAKIRELNTRGQD